MSILKFIKPILVTVSLILSPALFSVETIKLDGGIFDKVEGSAKVEDAEKVKKKVTLNLTGLKANGLYTVWLVNEKPKMSMNGLGTGEYSFKADDQGKATYTAEIDADELEKWQIIKVAFHPDGNPKNMKDIESAATGKIEDAQRTAE